MINAKQQQGAVLAISLIILLVITIVGLSSMSTTTLEEKMAQNFQADTVTFQGAESAITEGVEDIAFLNDVFAAGPDPVTPTSMNVTYSKPSVTLSLQGEYQEKTARTGEAADTVRQGAAGLNLYHYSITGGASLSNSSVRAQHVQGAYLQGAADSTYTDDQGSRHVWN